MNLREALLQAANQIQVIVEGQIRVQATYDVKFGRAFADALGGALKHFIESPAKSIGTGRVRRAPKGAKLAMGHADVRRIDVAINVVVAEVAVTLFANVIRKPAQRQHVVGLEEGDALRHVETLASQHFGGDRIEAAVADLQTARGGA